VQTDNQPTQQPSDAEAAVASAAPAASQPLPQAVVEARSFESLAEQPESPATPSAPAPADGHATPLLTEQETQDFRGRWDSIQAGFVDEPRIAVEQAYNLTAQAMKRMSDVFAQERANLESQWARGDDVSTEDLRLALRRYRTFFDRLLSI